MNVKKANEIFVSLTKLDPCDTTALCLYGMFLFKTRNFVKSEESFLLSLEANPENKYALLQYCNFLDVLGHPASASAFYDEFIVLKHILSPLTYKEEANHIRVFLEDGSFKSLTLTASTTVTEIAILMCKARGVTYHSKEWALFRVEPKVDVQDLSRAQWENILDPQVKTPLSIHFSK